MKDFSTKKSASVIDLPNVCHAVGDHLAKLTRVARTTIALRLHLDE